MKRQCHVVVVSLASMMSISVVLFIYQFMVLDDISTPVSIFPVNTSTPDDEVHIVFSTGCTQNHADLLALNLQQSAVDVGHTGSITRIVAGCTDARKLELIQLKALHPNYRLHFTPDYSKQRLNENTTDTYLPYNKPHSLRHWLAESSVPIREKNIALVDADFVFLKPLVVNTPSAIIRYAGDRSSSRVTNYVARGFGVAQNWRNYLGAGYWTKPEKIQALCQDGPCRNVTRSDAEEYYAVGPPYIMHIDDMRAFVDDYVRFTIAARTIDKGWMVEMYGFVLAAANHGIKFTMLTDLGVTSPQFKNKGREYWTFVDQLNENPCNKQQQFTRWDSLPVGLHLCQKYTQGEGYYYKYAMPNDLLNCDSLLFQPPPESAWTTADSTHLRGMAWVECTAIRSINQMLLAYKARSCPNGFNARSGFLLSSDQKTNAMSALPSKHK